MRTALLLREGVPRPLASIGLLVSYCVKFSLHSAILTASQLPSYTLSFPFLGWHQGYRFCGLP